MRVGKQGFARDDAGSAHLTDPSAGIYASPILSAMIPVAVGAALSFKMDSNQKVAVAVFGDAAIEEGVFAESVNFAVTNVCPYYFYVKITFIQRIHLYLPPAGFKDI